MYYNTDKGRWTRKKKESKVMAKKIYVAADTLPTLEREKFRRRAARMASCADTIISNVCPECGTRYIKNANLCRDRLCPTCAWRRSRALSAKLGATIATHTQKRYLLLTLTMRNGTWDSLAQDIAAITRAWGKFSRWVKFTHAVSGWARTLEITAKNGSVHPHLHVLLEVPPDYFQNSDIYMEQTEIVRQWQKKLNVPYTPVVDIRSVRSNELQNAVMEVTKYITKNTQVDNLSETELIKYARAIAGVRLWATGGSLRVTEEEVENSVMGEEKNHTHCQNCGSPLIEVVEKWDDIKKEYEVITAPPLISSITNFGTIIINAGQQKKTA